MMGVSPHASDSLFNIQWWTGWNKIHFGANTTVKKQKKSEILILWLHVVTSHVHVQYNKVHVYEFMKLIRIISLIQIIALLTA